MELFEAEVWLGQMARLRNFETKTSLRGFRAVLFRMVPKLDVMLNLSMICKRLLKSLFFTLNFILPSFLCPHKTSFTT